MLVSLSGHASINVFLAFLSHLPANLAYFTMCGPVQCATVLVSSCALLQVRGRATAQDCLCFIVCLTVVKDVQVSAFVHRPRAFREPLPDILNVPQAS